MDKELYVRKNWLSAAPELNDREAEEAFAVCVETVKRNMAYFGRSFPAAASVDGIYPKTANDDWTDGFWTGELWLSYEETKDPAFKREALASVADFERRMKERVVVDHHDMGFLFSPSCVAAWRLLKGEEAEEAAVSQARRTALAAADNLMGRFQEKGGFFQAWGTVGDPKEYRLIIDCLLNMPLLFWASEVTGNPVYCEKAKRHIRTAMACVVREDYSTYHTYYCDPETGAPVKGITQQGNRDGSIWARGQAWGIYGTALSYEYFHNPEYERLFDGVTACFMEHLPSDLIPYWDFDFHDGSGEPRDSSAAAIAACGLLEMARCVDQEKAKLLTSMAAKLMKALTDRCLLREGAPGAGILLHGTYAKRSEENGVHESGVDECNLWGDYFYMEALMRMRKDWERYW